MHLVSHRAEGKIFEVVLYYGNKSWAFSIYEKAGFMEDALKQAEQYFSLHLAPLDFSGLRQPAYAHVLACSHGRWFVKHSGNWEPAQHALEMPLPPPVGLSGKHTLALVL